MLQSDSLKLGSCKFNVIINIINITFKSDVVAKLKILEYSFTEKPKIFKFYFFIIFFIYKKNNLQHHAGRLRGLRTIQCMLLDILR